MCLTGWFLLLRIFSVDISVSPHVCFILDLILISMFLSKCTYELEIFHANQTTKCLRNQDRTKGKGWSTTNELKPSVISLLGVPRRLFRFGSLDILDVARCYLCLFSICKYKNR